MQNLALPAEVASSSPAPSGTRYQEVNFLSPREGVPEEELQRTMPMKVPSCLYSLFHDLTYTEGLTAAPFTFPPGRKGRASTESL